MYWWIFIKELLTKLANNQLVDFYWVIYNWCINRFHTRLIAMFVSFFEYIDGNFLSTCNRLPINYPWMLQVIIAGPIHRSIFEKWIQATSRNQLIQKVSKSCVFTRPRYKINWYLNVLECHGKFLLYDNNLYRSISQPAYLACFKNLYLFRLMKKHACMEFWSYVISLM